jgi:hypothetical protein
MYSLKRLILSIQMRRRAASQGSSEDFREGDTKDKVNLTFTREQAEELKKGTVALFTSSIHP